MRRLEISAQDTRKVWSIFHELVGTNIAALPSELTVNGGRLSGMPLANALNEHFVNSRAPNSTPPPSVELDCEKYISHYVTDSVFMAPTSEAEIASVIMSFNSKSAAGEDDIKLEPIKAVSLVIAGPLTHICNNILTSATFPDRMKIARVTVSHRGGKSSELNNFRPIYVLPFFSKIMERVIHSLLQSFLSAKRVISDK